LAKVKKLIKIVAHRGASAYEPENTLRSFELAIKMGANCLECDVRLSADGHIVVIHDATVNRTTNGYGKVSKMTLDELRKLDAGKGEKIPLLSEVIELCKKNGTELFIEIKTAKIVKKLVEVIRESGYEKCYVISFLFSALRKFHEQMPQYKIGFLSHSWKVLTMWLAKRYFADFICPRADLLTKRAVKKFHQAGFSIFAWTVNTLNEAEKISSLGVAAIGTDRPDLIRAVLKGEPYKQEFDFWQKWTWRRRTRQFVLGIKKIRKKIRLTARKFSPKME
jgi:glycerophosphoryl diester phosphodiesterase